MVERVSTKLNVCIMGKLNSYMRVWPLDCKVVERVSIPHELMLPVTHGGGGTCWMSMGLGHEEASSPDGRVDANKR